MYCTRVKCLEDAIESQSIKEIVRLAVLITYRLEFLQAGEWPNFKGEVFMEGRYGGEGNQKIVGAKPYFTRNLVDLAVKDDHLSTEGFERSQAKVAMLEKSR